MPTLREPYLRSGRGARELGLGVGGGVVQASFSLEMAIEIIARANGTCYGQCLKDMRNVEEMGCNVIQ